MYGNFDTLAYRAYYDKVELRPWFLKHLQKCFRDVDFPGLGRGCKNVIKCFILHVTTSKNVLAVVKIILSVWCLLPNIHEPALLQPNTVFPLLT